MAIHVTFYPEHKSVLIDKSLFTQQELEEKLKSPQEHTILKTLDTLIEIEKRTRAQLEINYSDVEQLVLSDMFKGDYHSRALIRDV